MVTEHGVYSYPVAHPSPCYFSKLPLRYVLLTTSLHCRARKAKCDLVSARDGGSVTGLGPEWPFPCSGRSSATTQTRRSG